MTLLILEPAISRKLTTVDAVKLDLQLSGSSDDAYLVTLIDQASDAIQSWCKRSFAIETVRETILPAAPGKPLMLSRWPVITVSALTVNGVAHDIANVEIEDSGHIVNVGPLGCRVPWPAVSL